MLRWAIVLGIITLGGCSQLTEQISDEAFLLRHGVGAEPDPVVVKKYRERQDDYPVEYMRAAGLTREVSQITATEWPLIVRAGINQITARCEAYKDAIDQVNRSRKAVNTELAAVGAASAAIMGVAGASAKAIAITASAFGLAILTSDNLHSAVLYDLEPASVKTIIDESQAAVLKEIDKREIKTRVDAEQALQSFISTCLPTAIEANINQALKNSQASAETKGGVTRVKFNNPLVEKGPAPK